MIGRFMIDKNVVKKLLSFLSIAALIVWVYYNGEIINQISVVTIATATLVSVVILLLNASVLNRSVNIYRGKLSYSEATFLTSTSAFANSLGGLPIGSVAKYILLYKKSGLSKTQILAGQLFFTLLNIVFLLALALFSLDIWYALVFIVLFFVVGWCVLSLSFELLAPLKSAGILMSSLCLSFSVSLAMVVCYLCVLSATVPIEQMLTYVPVICFGLIMGFGSGAPSLGGLQEILMGLSSYLLLKDMTTGVELSLIIRLVSLLSAVPLLIATLKARNE